MMELPLEFAITLTTQNYATQWGYGNYLSLKAYIKDPVMIKRIYYGKSDCTQKTVDSGAR